jgi:hypothetical protein
VLLLGTLGLKTTTLRMIDVTDVDLRCELLSVREKGARSINSGFSWHVFSDSRKISVGQSINQYPSPISPHGGQTAFPCSS